MVIQSLNNTYSRIPDEEDVTPIDHPISRSAKSNYKVYLYIFSAAIGLAVVSTCIWKFTFSRAPTVAVYCTSHDKPEGLHTLTLKDIQQDLPQIKSISFGNADCHGKECSSLGANVGNIFIEPALKFQKVVGFGGAFTEASAHNFYKLPKAVRDRVIQLYFGDNGIGLNMGRIHINSCDFSLEPYSFDNVPEDYDLQFFDDDVTHDNLEIIPFILEAKAVSKQPIHLVASPWSPPAWMKVPVLGNATMTHSAVPSGLKSDPRVRLAWARYISRFISAYQRKNVDIWALTPQNEPEFPAPWEACSYNATAEADFIQNYLGPIIKSDHPDIKILAFDHNKDHLQFWAETILSNDKKNNYVDGMAFHWYGGDDRLTDGTYGYNAVNMTHHLFPDKLLLSTEGCSCPGVRLDDWLRAERLGHDVIYDLLNHAQGWIDWNLLVDSLGGPNHLKNYCDASLIVNKDFSDIHIQPKYYYFGHFSKFLKPGSVRVQSKVVGNFALESMNPNIQPGVELGMFYCEKSARQMWILHPDSRSLQLSNLVTTEWEVNRDGKVQLCVAHGDSNRNFFRLAACDVKKGSNMRLLKLQFQTETGQAIDLDSGMCLSLAGDVREPGALLELTPCMREDNSHQVFSFNELTGEIYGHKSIGLCLTAGWPYLSAVAFQTPSPSEQTAVVVMNEAPVQTNVVLHDKSRASSLAVSMPKRSILTFLY